MYLVTARDITTCTAGCEDIKVRPSLGRSIAGRAGAEMEVPLDLDEIEEDDEGEVGARRVLCVCVCVWLGMMEFSASLRFAEFGSLSPRSKEI